MDTGARADCGSDGFADSRGDCGRLELRAASALGTAILMTSGVALGAASDFEWHLPQGFPIPAVPVDNPMSQVKVELGRRLFRDRRLSLTGSYSCASCHDPERSFSDGRRVAVGATGQLL